MGYAHGFVFLEFDCLKDGFKLECMVLFMTRQIATMNLNDLMKLGMYFSQWIVMFKITLTVVIVENEFHNHHFYFSFE